MKKLGYSLLIVCGLLTACSTPQRSAPVTERSGQARVVAGQGYYVVQKGDTLTQIARRHGQSTASITAWNNIDNPNNIKVGQVLRVSPTAAPVTPVASATDGAQTASVASASSVEVRPLSQEGATTKTGPSGSKKPYSESTTTTPVVAKTEGNIPAADTEKVNWMWPASGKVVADFQGGKNKGLDIASKNGDKILSAADGKVIYTGIMKGYGILIIIKHTEDMLSAYSYNPSIMPPKGEDANRAPQHPSILVKKDQTIKRGQQIARMDDSNANSVKLHFEIRRQGKPVDPAQYLPPR